ncbi:hypothetical protein WJM97_01835 [Okeanomitos corallinicola TIOX110]|uniref:PEP-CTERM sorting domain-containing protein n=1 Tax=Okeanomitos corallinicola TIOX110 TaxID=3133117 RepID=A0ABZ2UST8_9CYAN
MKLSRILPLVVGGAVAGMVVSAASPAQALEFNWTITNLTFADGSTGSGTLTYDDVLGQITDVNINISSVPLGNISLVAPPSSNIASSSSSVLQIFSTAGTFEGLQLNFSPVLNTANPGITAGFYGNTVAGVNSSLTSGTIASAAVPFDTPAGQAMATVGSLFAIGLMRQVKKRLAVKKLVVNPMETVVS